MDSTLDVDNTIDMASTSRFISRQQIYVPFDADLIDGNNSSFRTEPYTSKGPRDGFNDNLDTGEAEASSGLDLSRKPKIDKSLGNKKKSGRKKKGQRKTCKR